MLCLLVLCLFLFLMQQSSAFSKVTSFSIRSNYKQQLRPLKPPRSTSVNSGFGTLISKKSKSTDTISKIVSPFAKCYSGDTVLTAVKAMNDMNKGAVLVFDRQDEKLKGIFTERDFVNKVFNTEKSSVETVVDEVMTPAAKLILGKPTDLINTCQSSMISKKIRHLPIVDEVEKVIGIVSMSDIMKAVRESEVEECLITDTLLFGDSLQDVQEQSKDIANRLALEEGEEGTKTDLIRSGFVITAACVMAALLQGSWVHDHEWLSMSGTFILGYIGIVFENYFEFNKAAIALLMATALWVIFAGTAGGSGVAITAALGDLSEKVSEVSEVVFFILGAMTIVEIVDAHKGFKVVTDVIDSKTKRGLMWVISLITFFMSAILDNLTTTIVMVSLMKKILPKSFDDRKLFGALIVIAANAGGAWTPIGDVTTTMLWINGQISALPTMTGLFLPSIASVLISTYFLQLQIPEGTLMDEKDKGEIVELAPRGKLVFATGIAGLLSVPVFKALTGLPPYLGMLSALGVMWSLTDAIHAGDREELKAPAALRKIDTSGVLFFLGILLSVGALDSAGLLRSLAEFLDKNIPDDSIVATFIGLASALIDNVPLVAATMGMYPIGEVPMDSQLWQLIAFCAGTGGSLLVIGSAAGVALMGLEKVDFVWYAKKISLPALAGYIGGIAAYLAQYQLSGAGVELAVASSAAIQSAALDTSLLPTIF